MLFSFKKLKINGEVVTGVLDVGSINEAETRILEPGELLVELKALKKIRKYRLKAQDVLDFTTQLHQLIQAGLPVYESLLSLKEKKLKYHDLLNELSNDIKKGNNFSSAIKNQTGSFSSVYVSIIQASEAAGELKDGLSSLKDLMLKQSKIKKILKNALIYPAILLGFSFIIVNVMLLFIIPSLKELFEGRDVNSLTNFILNLSTFYLGNFQYITIFYLILTGFISYLIRKGKITTLLLKIFDKFSFGRDLLISIKLENFFSCLGLLLIRGINLKDALVLSKNIVKFPQLEKHVEEIIQGILRGKKFSDLMAEPFPFVAKRLIALSELTGQMGKNCQMLTDIFHENVERKLQILSTLLQPLLLAIIGLIIGVVILSILMPLTDVGGFI